MIYTKVWTFAAFNTLLQTAAKPAEVPVYLHLSFDDERFHATNSKQETVVSRTHASLTAVFSDKNNIIQSCEASLVFYNDFIADPIVDPMRKVVALSKQLHEAGYKVYLGYQGLDTSLTVPSFNILSYAKLAEVFDGPTKRDYVLNILSQIFDDFAEYATEASEASSVKKSAKEKLASFATSTKKG